MFNLVQVACQEALIFKEVATKFELLEIFSTATVSRSTAMNAVWPSCVLPKGEMKSKAHPTHHQFFHIILHLMNKPLLSSGSAIRAFRAGAILFAMLFVVGVSTSMAQTDRQSASTLTGSQSISKPTVLTSSSATFVPNNEAITLLKSEISALQSAAAASAQAEADAGATSSYYMAVLEGLSQGGNIADIFDNSSNQLYSIVATYELASRPDFATIRQNLFDLVTL